jgi:ribosome-binding protein aMBF1 (putative translation factor)
MGELTIMDQREARMKCDTCRRIIIKDSPTVIPCTACGHGHLREMIPRNWCCLCGEPQYDNVSKPPVQVECARCVDSKVEKARKLEADLRVDFSNTAEMRRARDRAVVNQGKRDDGELRTARQKRGWSQSELAIHLGVARQMVQQMETGKRPYGEKAKKWIESMAENV